MLQQPRSNCADSEDMPFKTDGLEMEKPELTLLVENWEIASATKLRGWTPAFLSAGSAALA